MSDVENNQKEKKKKIVRKEKKSHACSLHLHSRVHDLNIGRLKFNQQVNLVDGPTKQALKLGRLQQSSQETILP